MRSYRGNRKWPNDLELHKDDGLVSATVKLFLYCSDTTRGKPGNSLNTIINKHKDLENKTRFHARTYPTQNKNRHTDLQIFPLNKYYEYYCRHELFSSEYLVQTSMRTRSLATEQSMSESLHAGSPIRSVDWVFSGSSSFISAIACVVLDYQ